MHCTSVTYLNSRQINDTKKWPSRVAVSKRKASQCLDIIQMFSKGNADMCKVPNYREQDDELVQDLETMMRRESAKQGDTTL